MFSVGHEYTWDEIGDHVGGNKQTYLPTRDGIVVAACLTKELNPLAPRVVLCGTPPRIARAGELLARQAQAIRVFVKRDVNRWEYQGHFRPAASYTSGPEYERLIDGSGRSRSDVTRVVVLEPFSISMKAIGSESAILRILNGIPAYNRLTNVAAADDQPP